MTRVGLVEDNEDFRVELVYHLRRAGFQIAFESDGTQVDQLLLANATDLLLLDLSLPTEDGLEIAARVRNRYPQMGIAMVTARAELSDRLSGYQQGADAYLAKPVDMRELVACLQSLGRRIDMKRTGTESAGWALYPAKLAVSSPDGKWYALTHAEACILEAMASAQPEAATKAELTRAMGYADVDWDSRRCDAAVGRIRHKLDNHAELPLIRSVRGVGYLFTAPLKVN